MNKKTVEINISGIVQGVGMRPYLFNMARKLNLKGYLLNRGNAGVRLVIQGEIDVINEFIEKVRREKPQISFIEKIEQITLNTTQNFDKLEIRKSEEGRGISLTLPPDIAICEDCLRDMRNSNLPKYHSYPFVACAVCGPRFTTVKTLPYDRERTTMRRFPLCEVADPCSCLHEYTDFENRRFHAQTFACSVCGPNYRLYNKSKEIIREDSIFEILRECANKINVGDIAAVKGIGGIHLVCLAKDDETILKLRRRKGKRKNKPFALMVPNLDLIEKYLRITDTERTLLNSFRRPIVLLERKNEESISIISDQVAPGLSNVGVMLPYSGIHYLLFDFVGNKPLVYTSGNASNIPMGIENEKIFNQLHDLADIFLLHDRPIYQRADDSVIRIHDLKAKLIRRSRGYVPEYIPLPFEVEISGALATGPELSSTAAVLRRNRIFPSQHIGNVTHFETYNFLKEALFHMKNLLQIKDTEIEFISCDKHPLFVSTKLANELSLQYSVPLFPIQHHIAHVLSLMVDNNVWLDEKIVGISTDGVGYGDDGNIWGGEIFVCSYKEYKRHGHLEYQPMIGGDRCTKFPARMAASILLKTVSKIEAEEIFKNLKLAEDLEYKDTELNALMSQFEKINSNYLKEKIPLSSSTGRIFDTVSYLLKASNLKTYRGEPAMKLESLASKGNSNKIKLSIGYEKKNGMYIINTSDLIINVLKLLENPHNKREDIAASFQCELGKIFGEIAIKIAKEKKIAKVGLTGGVAYNYTFSKAIKKVVIESGLKFLEHERIPPGDAGISVGQLTGGIFRS